MRNITMSGLGCACVIVEAGEHSGTRTLARAAIEHGRAVILTDLVARHCQWANDFRRRPGVYVAAGTADIVGLLGTLADERDDDAPSVPAKTPAAPKHA
jgi:predicted Rossmann fold nucleotide-binding protein DprA/Smf involved in DNA uptake